MNGVITSKNFKATFKFHTDASIESVEFTGTSSEARKYLKAMSFMSAFAIQDIVQELGGLEVGLREFVLAKIGG